MDKKLAGMIGMVSVLAVPATAATAPPVDMADALQAHSYADLLKPIPNAVDLLKAADAAARVAPGEAAPIGDATVQPAQFVIYLGSRRHHHHHHHHHHRYYHHHHHHHHHNRD
jgi:hypothetical protein